ncbi:MAG: hypothetical protein NZM44_06775 [Candidatus Calescibacterium sp.]|nr:hypothetical protein [Candidatus Calescibacterium sp.]
MNNKLIKNNRLSKMFLVITIFVLIAFITLKIFAKNESSTDKNVVLSTVNIYDVTKNNSEIEKFEKVWEFLYTFKGNKELAYELRRRIEKQELLSLLINQDNFKDMVKSLKYNQDQKKLIANLFVDEEKFYQAFYEFYFYLIMSQLDDAKISELKKQAEFIKRKIYKIDPQVIQKIKEKNDSELSQLLQEVDKSLYQPNLSERKISILLSELNKINYIVSSYEIIKSSESFKWFVNKRKSIINSLVLKKGKGG